MEQKVTSACPLNCWDACGFEVTINENEVVKVEGAPHHPITQGKICGRGRMLADRTNSKERITYPLKKIDGWFVRISWEQALDEIANRMLEVKETDGPTAVMHSHDYSNNGLLKNLDQRFFNCFGGSTEVVGSLCWGAGIEAQRWDFGNSYSHAPEDALNSKHIVIWGRNVARTNMHFYSILKKAKKNGASIVVIDPLYQATGKLANLYIPIRPGTDSMLALGIMKEIIRMGLEARQFIDEHSHGFEDVQLLLDEVTLNEIEDYTGVPQHQISQLAIMYGNGPTSTYFGLGLQRYENGGHTIRAIDALVAMSGNIGIEGGGANYANVGVGQSFTTETLTMSERKTKLRQFTRMKQAEQILKAKAPEIKLLFVTRGNPLSQLPNTTVVKEAFETVQTKVVIDQFMTDTAQMADYFLPCTTVFEEEDLYFSSMYHHYINYGPKLVEAKGEAKSDRWIWTQLAKRLGFGNDFDYTIDEFLEMGLGSLVDEGITLEQIKTEKTVKLPLPIVPWGDYRFETPTGKYEFTSLIAEREGKNGRLSIEYPFESAEKNPNLANKYPYQLLSLHPLRSNHSQHYPFIRSAPKVEVSSEVARKHQLSSGDEVIVFNERGELSGICAIHEQGHPLTINIDEGNWEQFGGTVNLLTNDRQSLIGIGGTQYDCLVNIRKA